MQTLQTVVTWSLAGFAAVFLLVVARNHARGDSFGVQARRLLRLLRAGLKDAALPLVIAVPAGVVAYALSQHVFGIEGFDPRHAGALDNAAVLVAFGAMVVAHVVGFVALLRLLGPVFAGFGKAEATGQPTNVIPLRRGN